MTNYREILRLHSLELNKTEIAASLSCSRNTVAGTLRRADECGLKYPLPESMSDKQLSETLFPAAASKPVYRMPDYEYVHKELQKDGVTLNLLWLEYRCDLLQHDFRADRTAVSCSGNMVSGRVTVIPADSMRIPGDDTGFGNSSGTI